MPRIQPNSSPEAEAQQVLDGVNAKLGTVPNIFKTMAHSPATLNFYTAASGALASSKLSAGLREQIALTVAGENNCDYCASAHTLLGEKAGVDKGELTNSLSAKSGDTKVQAALTFSKKVVEARGNVSDADVQAVRDAGYSEGEITDMIAVISINIFTNYFNHIADTEVDFPKVSAKATAAV